MNDTNDGAGLIVTMTMEVSDGEGRRYRRKINLVDSFRCFSLLICGQSVSLKKNMQGKETKYRHTKRIFCFHPVICISSHRDLRAAHKLC